MTLRFLTNTDFYISQSNQGPVLSHKIPNLSIVLYFSDKCPYCVTFKPVFINASETIYNCSFAIANVSQHPLIVSLSKETITEIKYVPLIIIYINGNPYMEYTGNLDSSSLIQFIYNVSDSLNQKMSFSNNPSPQHISNPPNNSYISNNNTPQQPHQPPLNPTRNPSPTNSSNNMSNNDINVSGLNCSMDNDGNVKCLRGNTKQSCYLTFDEAYGNKN